MSFFVIVQQALYNDMIAHAIKILDTHSNARGLQYIKEVNMAAFQSSARRHGIDLSELETLAAKLKRVRDKTHFHIDADSVKDPRAVWASADIDGGLFSRSLTHIAVLLAELKKHLFEGDPLEVTKYDGSDIRKIVKAYEVVHGITHGA